jgi:hypothetical protein
MSELPRLPFYWPRLASHYARRSLSFHRERRAVLGELRTVMEMLSIRQERGLCQFACVGVLVEEIVDPQQEMRDLCLGL